MSCSGRNLTWQTNMGTVDLKATFDKRYEFQVSTGQAAPLQLLLAKCTLHMHLQLPSHTRQPNCCAGMSTALSETIVHVSAVQ